MSEWKETEIGRLPSHWDVGVFDKDLKIQGRIGWKGYKTSDLVPFGPYVVGGAEIKSSIFLDLKNAQCLSREKYEESPEIMLKDGDVLLVTRGNLGEVGYYHKMYGEGTINPSVIILNNFKGDSRFLFYYLSSKQGNNNVMSLASGSSVPAIYQADVKTLKYPRPPIEEQIEISKIAFSIDLKIDLLHRQNATLEKMAETLFRQWFVEEAKEDWEEISLYDAIELVGGGTPKTTVSEYWDGNIKWLSGGDIASNHKSFVVSSEKSITELGLKNSSAKLLPKFSTVISARGTVGKYCMLSESMTFSQSNYGILPKFNNCFFFTYLLVAHSVDELQSAAYGSVFDTITTNTFKGLTITLPEEEDIIRFNESMKPYFSKILTNQTQIRTLTALRDTLLPKLMCGEVRV